MLFVKCQNVVMSEKIIFKKIPIFRSFVESFHTSATLCFWRRFIHSTWRHWIRDWLNFYLYKLIRRKRKEICKKKSFLKFQLTHFSKHNNLESITYAVRSFLSLRRHPGIDFKLTSDVFRIFGGVDLFRLSVFVVKYFSLCSVKSADLLQCAFFSAFAFTH